VIENYPQDVKEKPYWRCGKGPSSNDSNESGRIEFGGGST
jgi:hypothetical protein